MSTAVMCPSCRNVVSADDDVCPSCGEQLAIGDAPTRKAHTDPWFGMSLGDYRLEARIGIGGMGYVYRAVNPVVGNVVAIKVLRPDVISNEADLQRFLDEARAVNQVRHPGVVSIFGAGDTPDGRKYLVMELLQGESLESLRARKGRLSSMEALPILEDVLAALSAVHAAGVVHRDLKPANVFLAKESDGRTLVKLLDFGLARRSNLQEVSRIAGTPDYISPEHARGKAPGPPADLYALGVMAFHLLTGRLPFIADNPVDLMAKHVREPPPDPGVLDGSIPSSLCKLIVALMAKEAVARPAAAEVREALQTAGTQLRTAATQVVKRVTGDVAERPTSPELASMPSPSRDTDPVLGAAGPIPGAQLTPTTAPQPVAATPSAVPRVRDTAADLSRFRWLPFVVAAGVSFILVVSVRAVMTVRAIDAQPEMARPAGSLGLRPVTERDRREALKERAEHVQALAHAAKAADVEVAASRLLLRLDASRGDQHDALERELEALEARVTRK